MLNVAWSSETLSSAANCPLSRTLPLSAPDLTPDALPSRCCAGVKMGTNTRKGASGRDR